ncbi:MAG: C25 family cysteine peptidase, partial [Bacteroidales bacterium]|nr:C25 family cysteine peptidase [Bacteroidales bacterium]
MKKIITLCTLFILLAIGLMAQTWTAISSNLPIAVQQKLLSSSDESIKIRFAVSGFFMTPVDTPRGDAVIISVPKMVSMLEAGFPDVPQYGVSAIIPGLALMKVRILESEYTDFYNIEIAPSKGNFSRKINPDSVAYTYDEVYNLDTFYPAMRSDLQEPYILRDFRGQTVMIYPFSYNPLVKTLRVFHELTIEMYNDGLGGANQFIRTNSPDKMDSEFKHLYQNHFINYPQTRYPALSEEGKLLIICHGPFMQAMQPFVHWKKTIGRPTEIVDVATIGTTPTAIKNFVTNYYNTNGLTHLLLVGDHQHVPSQSMSGGYSDYFYGYLTGSDSYNEVFVGRFSAETVAHVETHVQKVIHYERDIDQTAIWLNVGLGMARNEGAGGGHNGGEADYVHMDYIRDSLLNYTYATVYREYDGSVPNTPNTSATLVSQRLNEGVGILNYCNHGSISGWSVAGYSNSHVNALVNSNKLPVVWSVACDVGNFTGSTICFAEYWMRATHNTSGEPTGAVGGKFSWISQPWQPPMTGQDEMVTILVEGYLNNIKRTLGGNSTNGSMKMIDLHGSSGRTTHDTWILFGDPSLTMRTANPIVMNISHLPTAFLGWTAFTVNADAEGAIVSLTINGDILGTGYINGGSATINIPVLNEPGLMTVAVFAYNRVTYIQNVEVVPAVGPYIMLHDYTINDASGNNNGLADYGETISLNVTLKNVGADPSGVVTTTLSGSD